MALRFLESFDHLVTADLLEKWSSLTGWTVSAGTGRRGTASGRFTTNGWIERILDNQPTWICGFAFRLSQFPATVATLLEFRDATSIQVDLRVLPGGTLQATRNGTVLGATTAALSLSTYAYIECLATIHPTAGAITVALDGVPRLTLTNVNTRNTANAYANQIRLGNTSGSNLGACDLDDVYLCDGTGSSANTLLGDCRVDALLPTADGTLSAWTVSTGTTHSTLVDETAPNDDTDYLSTSTAGARESHALANLPTMPTPAILGVQHSLSARKDDAGTRQVKSLLKSGATTQTGSLTHTLTTSYAYYSQVWPTDPNTGAAWTVAAVNALEAGMEAQ